MADGDVEAIHIVTDTPQSLPTAKHHASPDGVPASTVVQPAEHRLLTRDFVFATLANFINSLGVQMLMATLPVYVLSLGGGQADVGLVTGAMAGTALILRPLVGWLADSQRRHPLILASTLCYSLASVVYGLAGSLSIILMGRTIQGMGVAGYTTGANAYVADIAPPRRRAEAIGIFASVTSIGLILGPAAGFVIVGMFGFQQLFFLTAALSFIAFLILIPTRERPRTSKAKARPWSLRTGLVATDALPMAWAALCLGIGFGASISFLSIFADLRGLGNPGLYFSVQALALLVSRGFCGRLADLYDRSAVIIPGTVTMALALAVLPLAYDFPAFLVSTALFGLGYGATQPATMALMVDRVRAEQRGLAMSTYFLGFDSGIALGSIVLGVVGQYWGFETMWLLSAAGTLLGLAELWGGFGKARVTSRN